jgi:hypothetical protein
MFINSNENYVTSSINAENDVAFNATNQHFIQLMPLITIQLLIKKTFSCTNDVIAKDDGNI